MASPEITTHPTHGLGEVVVLTEAARAIALAIAAELFNAGSPQGRPELPIWNDPFGPCP